MARLERVLVSSRKTSLLIMLGKVLQSSCRMKMDVMMMPRASDCASTLRPYAHQMATVVTWLAWVGLGLGLGLGVAVGPIKVRVRVG